MFRRLVFEHWVSIFPLVSFVVASVIYAGFFRGALGMGDRQSDRLAALPLEGETSSIHHHDSSSRTD